MIRYADICAGISAATCAWKPLGWRAAFYAESDKFPSAVLAHHYPETPNLGDITRFEGWPDADFDVLIGGTPCQGFSVAGQRKGLDDPRSNLALCFGRIAQRFKPRWIVWENVPGVRSLNAGADFGSFLGGLAELGYGLCYRSFDAQYAGLAQRRERVFVVGHLGDWRRAAAVLLEPGGLRWNPAPRREAGQGTAAAIGGGPDGGRISGAVTSKWLKGGGPAGDEAYNLVAHALRADGFDASEDGTGRGTPIVAFDTTQVTSKGNYSKPKAGDPCHPLAAGAHPPAIAFAADDYEVGTSFEHCDVARPLTTSADRTRAAPVVSHGYAVRRLTPLECERLMGFPRHFTRIPWRGKPAESCPDGPRYKALGNSIAVPDLAWIGRRIELCESAITELAEAA